MWCYITLALIVVSGLRADDASAPEDPKQTIRVALKTLIEKRCAENADNDALKELVDALRGVSKCVKESVPVPKNSEDSFSITCSSEAPAAVYGCLQNVLNKLEPCLDTEEKYLSDFVLSSFNTTIENLCKDGEQSLRELKQNLRDAECKIQFEEIGSSTGITCYSKLEFLKYIEPSDFVLTKSRLCSFLTTAKLCVINASKGLCKDDVTINKIIEKNFESVLSWCRDDTTENQIDSD